MNLMMINDGVVDCIACPNRKQLIPPCASNNVESKLMFILDHPSHDEGVLQDPLESRSGQNLKRMIEEVGLTPYITFALKCAPSGSKIDRTCYDKWLRNEIKAVKPNAVVGFGQLTTSLLLNKKTIQVKDVIKQSYLSDKGYRLYFWYSLNYIFQRGKKVEKETMEFLRGLKCAS